MEIKKIEITPEKNPEESLVQLTIKEDSGAIKEIYGLGGLNITAITDMDFYVSVQGNIVHTTNFIAYQMQDPESLIYQLFTIGMGASIEGCHQSKLPKLYETLSLLLDQLGQRQEEINKEDRERFRKIEEESKG